MIFASSPTPTPDGGAPDPDLVTPGTIGFLATLVIVILTIFLIRDALRRVRRVRARSGANDAYPIPLRRHVVPNQSTLSGPEAPEPETGERDTDAAADTGPSDAHRRGDATEEPIDSSAASA
ncbi:MAG: hypothetical protein ACTIIT_03580 [Brevibacterium linens]